MKRFIYDTDTFVACFEIDKIKIMEKVLAEIRIFVLSMSYQYLVKKVGGGVTETR